MQIASMMLDSCAGRASLAVGHGAQGASLHPAQLPQMAFIRSNRVPPPPHHSGNSLPCSLSTRPLPPYSSYNIRSSSSTSSIQCGEATPQPQTLKASAQSRGFSRPSSTPSTPRISRHAGYRQLPNGGSRKMAVVAAASSEGEAATTTSTTTTTSVTAKTGAENPTIPQEKMDELVEFLKEDLVHLFDDQGIDKSKYDSKVEFVDPITKYDNIEGYLFNITMLRYVFSPNFFLHQVSQTGPDEITTRWTMDMTFRILPWQPKLTFTGNSIMRVSPTTLKFDRHEDIWDSLDNNAYFSIDGLRELLTQASNLTRTPELGTPKFVVLKKLHDYEIRQYEPFVVAEIKMSPTDSTAGSTGFRQLAGYIFGRNKQEEKMAMTTPVFTTRRDASIMQFVMPLGRSVDSLPTPTDDAVKVTEVGGGVFAVRSFPGKAVAKEAEDNEAQLRQSLRRDGLPADATAVLARYNDPGTPDFFRRNEVLIPLEDYQLSLV